MRAAAPAAMNRNANKGCSNPLTLATRPRSLTATSDRPPAQPESNLQPRVSTGSCGCILFMSAVVLYWMGSIAEHNSAESTHRPVQPTGHTRLPLRSSGAVATRGKTGSSSSCAGIASRTIATGLAAGTFGLHPDTTQLDAHAHLLDCPQQANFSFIHIPKTAGTVLLVSTSPLEHVHACAYPARIVLVWPCPALHTKHAARYLSIVCEPAVATLSSVRLHVGREIERMFRRCCGLQFGQSYDQLRWNFLEEVILQSNTRHVIIHSSCWLDCWLLLVLTACLVARRPLVHGLAVTSAHASAFSAALLCTCACVAYQQKLTK